MSFSSIGTVETIESGALPVVVNSCLGQRVSGYVSFVESRCALLRANLKHSLSTCMSSISYSHGLRPLVVFSYVAVVVRTRRNELEGRR